MKKLKVLHITPWFPTENNPTNAIWIARHLEALSPFCENQVLHFVVNSGSPGIIRKQEKSLYSYVQFINSSSWRFTEILHFLLLSYYLLFKYKTSEFDIINFHIAYPNLVFFKLLKPFVKSKILITEHWSYYHYNFYSDKKLKRIKNIFHQNTTLIAVSESLHQDIEKFSGATIKKNIVANAVNTKIFSHDSRTKRDKTLVLGGFWKMPKRPFLFLDAVEDFLEKNPEWKIRIFGKGPMAQALEIWCDEWEQEWLGPLSPPEIADELSLCFGYVMPSDYETFSVGCAEALCCGTPILVSNNGALPSHVDESNGIVVPEDDWENMIQLFTSLEWNNSNISREANSKYSYAAVGMAYHNVLKSL